NDHAKVGDFGLARFFDKEQSDTRSTVMGTPTYMPPELWKGRVAPQSDQYCLACTYVELRTGHPAMRGKSQAELCEEHQRGSPDLRELTDAEMQVVLKALAKQLGDRYPTCGDFARALQYAVEPAAPRRDASADVRRARWTAILALVTSGALVATAIGGAFWYTTRRLEMPVARERAAQLESPAPPRTVEAPDLWVQAMVELSAGSTAPLDLDFQRFQTPATLHIEGVPQGVTLSGIPDGPLRNDGRLALAVVASEVVDTQQCTLEVFVRWGDAQQMTKSVDLRVRGFDLRMPPGYEPASGAERRAVPWEGRKYWTRIQHQMFPDCTLLLIPQERRPDPTDPADPPTYYILENKVSNQLWTAVVSAYPETSTSESWRQSDVWQRGVSNAGGPLVVADHPHLPVFHISANDAAEFARLLGGELPSFFQWDKAAGRFHPERGAGPFQGGWQPGDPAAIAVGREQLGPAAVGASSQDRSLYGCLDMSGNGEELTGKTYKNRPLPLGQPFLSDPEFNGVYVRGRSYTEETPLLFSDLDALDKEEREKGFCTAPSLGCDETRPFISFRIVVGSADKWVIAQSATAGPP
ncbi:MAG: SUMF1/EgtB/PvdO family nonheme iron enzyme, partial [Pirellulaceae bacterium]